MTRRPATHRRMAFVLAGWTALFAVIAGRLVFLQATAASRFVELGKSQRIRTNVLPAPRGDLLDRNGTPLAMTVPRYRIVADPAQIEDPRRDAAALAKVLRLDRTKVLESITRNSRYVVLAQQVDDAVVRAVKAADVAGVVIEDDPTRMNPAGRLARPVLGRVGTDDVGLSGLELVLDRRLQGRAGELLVERDPVGQEIAAGQRRVVPARPGTTFQLTLDRSLQYHVERLLGEQLLRTDAKKGTAIVMDPSNGDVLALANVTVNGDGTVSPSATNDAVVSVFEPGSVNKVITIAGVLEDGVAGPEQVTGVPDRLQVADHLFSDDEPHKTMAWTMRDVLVRSSNVGTIQLARKLGKERIDHYLRAFGFGTSTGLGFPGEASGLLLPTNRWSGTSIGTVPIGQGIAVTALQMLMAYNVLANDGVMAPARLVRATVDQTGRVRNVPVQNTSRVVSSKTAALLRSMLVDVVATGTGRAAAVEGYEVAGKTGTARKPKIGKRGYEEGAYIATFAGFVPAGDPRLSIIVVLDEPYPIYGGIVAAPLFSAIARFAVQHYRIPPDLGRSDSSAPAQPVLVVPSAPRDPIATGAHAVDAVVDNASGRTSTTPTRPRSRTTAAPSEKAAPSKKKAEASSLERVVAAASSQATATTAAPTTAAPTTAVPATAVPTTAPAAVVPVTPAPVTEPVTASDGGGEAQSPSRVPAAVPLRGDGPVTRVEGATTP